MRESLKARDNYYAYAYARDNGHLDFISKDKKCHAYFRGDQWDPTIKAYLQRLGKPALTINKVLASCASVFGEQIANRVDVSFRPSRGGDASTAAVLDKMWLQFVNSAKLDWLEAQVAAHAFIGSRGFFDLRVAFNDQLQGEARVKLLSPRNVVIDPDADSYDPDDWNEVFVTKWLKLDSVESTYGKEAAREVAARPDTRFTQNYDMVDWLPNTFGGEVRLYGPESDEDLKVRRIYRVVERQYKELRQVDHFVDVETGDMRPIPEKWSRQRISRAMEMFGLNVIKRPTEVIHWVTSLDDILLHDAISPLNHFTPVPYFPFFMFGSTVGIVENMFGPQDLLNKSLSQELHIVNTTANGGWKVKHNSLKNMTVEDLEERGAEDGLVLELSDTGDADKITPNQVPTGLDRVVYHADEAIKEVSMVSDSMRGFDRADVAAKAIQAKQMRGTVSLAMPFDNLTFTRYILARNWLDIVQEFYTEERVINVTGRNITDETHAVTVNQVTPEGQILNDLTAGEFDLVVSTVPTRETFEQSQFDEALRMHEAGIQVPQDVIVEHSHLERKNEIAQRMKELAGGGEPSERDQALAELEVQLKQLEAQEKQADIQVKQANAALSAARSQKEMVEVQGGGDDKAAEAAAKLEIEREKMALEREKVAQQIQLEREKVQAEIRLKYLELEHDMTLKEDRQESEIELRKQQAAAQKAQAQPQATKGESNGNR